MREDSYTALFVDEHGRDTAEELEGVADLRVAIRRFLAATNEVTRAHGLTPAQYDHLALLHRPGQAEVTATSIADALCLPAAPPPSC